MLSGRTLAIAEHFFFCYNREKPIHKKDTEMSHMALNLRRTGRALGKCTYHADLPYLGLLKKRMSDELYQVVMYAYNHVPTEWSGDVIGMYLLNCDLAEIKVVCEELMSALQIRGFGVEYGDSVQA